MRGRLMFLAGIVWLAVTQAAHATPVEYFELREGAVLESGDTWSLHGQRYRLYGVQSCLRGTVFTNNVGVKQDCGGASLAVLVAFIRDTHPSCAPIAKASSITYVVCFATIAGERLDLGTMLIAEGYAFAALDAHGLPINTDYSVAEQQARDRKVGLWQFPDIAHPAILLSRAAKSDQERSK
ncbi:thermonuclease family protein [Rhizobium tibeticum]|uniref:thermonuclease family protein n=1 Tax=Rhizobium tibeticum TaxID=501024 RepID=UPI0027D7E649|nr:thermonuclease family protein [Rhizobium tibeticum]